jgi:uncharacterized protein (TIGR00255 family)
MRSMTGFGERRFTAPGLRAKIGIKSLNHRFFDWNYRGAPLGELENRLRVLAQRKLLRVVINEALLEKTLAAMEKLSRRMGKAVTFSADSIFRIPQVVEIRRKELTSEMKSFLEKAFDQTLDQVLKVRCREGRETARQIQRHLRVMNRSLRRIESLARTQPRLIRARLAQRLKELNGNLPVEEEKVAGDAAYLIQKADIAEEIMRLHSHLGAFANWLRPEREEPVGKMLDFLSQEIVREANTVNSKSQTIAITEASLIIKGEVESIRQHIQNIE